MKKTRLLSVLFLMSSLLLVGCKEQQSPSNPDPDPGAPSEPTPGPAATVTLSSITVTPTVNVYSVGDTVDKSTLTVVANYSDNTHVTLTIDKYSISFNSSNPGESVPVVVTFEDKTATYYVKVNALAPTLESITEEHTVTEYNVNDTVDKSTLTVTAHYSDTSTVTIESSDYSLTYDFSNDGENIPVTITYNGKTVSYTVTVIDNRNYFPVDEINDFLAARNVDGFEFPSLEVSKDELAYHEVVDDEIPYYHLGITGNYSLYAIEYYFSGAGYAKINGKYVDPDNLVAIELSQNGDVFNFNCYAVSDLPVEDDRELLDDTTRLYDIFGKVSNLDGVSKTWESFTFLVEKNGGSNNPMSTNDDGSSLRLYNSNRMTISSTNSIKKIEFTYSSAGIEMSASSGSCSIADSKLVWTGPETTSLTLTNTGSSGWRLVNITIYYYDNGGDAPVDLGDVTIAEVISAANDITYTPASNGWYLSNTTVTVHVECIDAIDSVSTSNGLDPNARGKILAVDETGYIIVSSGTQTNPTLSLYQRVKKYLGKQKTTYDVTGRIAFFNDVIEIRADSYAYNDSLVIEKNYDSYVKTTFETQTPYINDVTINIRQNVKGYGVNNVVRYNQLTYFNKYNSAGSYLFLDKDGKIVPIYSLLDKDRPSLEEGKVYDIIGLESMYLGRPSLRILKVIHNDAEPVLEPDESVFQPVTTNFNWAYTLTMGSGKDYRESELIIFEADVYVSRYYNEDKYSINTSYFQNSNKDYDKFTTGNTPIDAANKRSLGVFNENLSYNGTFAGWVLEEAKTAEEAAARRVKIYFTLVRCDQVDSKNMWRVNILEDYVPEWVD